MRLLIIPFLLVLGCRCESPRTAQDPKVREFDQGAAACKMLGGAIVLDPDGGWHCQKAP